jgi:hypothetical protein
MSVVREFIHSFPDRSSEGMLSVDLSATPPAKIRVKVDDERNVWIAANREGWGHLARVASELAIGDYEAGFHLHVDFGFRRSFGPGPELSLEVADEVA